MLGRVRTPTISDSIFLIIAFANGIIRGRACYVFAYPFQQNALLSPGRTPAFPAQEGVGQHGEFMFKVPKVCRKPQLQNVVLEWETQYCLHRKIICFYRNSVLFLGKEVRGLEWYTPWSEQANWWDLEMQSSSWAVRCKCMEVLTVTMMEKMSLELYWISNGLFRFLSSESPWTEGINTSTKKEYQQHPYQKHMSLAQTYFVENQPTLLPSPQLTLQNCLSTRLLSYSMAFLCTCMERLLRDESSLHVYLHVFLIHLVVEENIATRQCPQLVFPAPWMVSHSFHRWWQQMSQKRHASAYGP